MATAEKPEAISAERLADLEYAVHLAMTGGKDPAFEARVTAESEKLAGEVRKKHGLLDVAVELIREAREGR